MPTRYLSLEMPRDADRVEKVALCGLFSFFATRMLNAYLETGVFINLLLLLNELVLGAAYKLTGAALPELSFMSTKGPA